LGFESLAARHKPRSDGGADRLALGARCAPGSLLAMRDLA
jgi:hypothetical protein